MEEQDHPYTSLGYTSNTKQNPRHTHTSIISDPKMATMQLEGMELLPGYELFRQALCLVRSDSDGEQWLKKMVYLACDSRKTSGLLLLTGFSDHGTNVLEEVSVVK